MWHTLRMGFLSFETAIAVTGKSRRTLWRRLQDEVLQRSDARGRTLIDSDWVRRNSTLPLDGQEWDLVVAADSGDAAAQCEVGTLCLQAGLHDSAVFWFREAAEHGLPDALHWLAHCHVTGKGVPQSDDLALSFLAKAAAAGHTIASEQMSGIKSRLLR
ncbi:hypothetical protein WG922_11600 [Ramlibacter sp. AN1015]|uniref:tetratricopeptide repeat protein n=1 Tax=Ramlibacter sp. AN1015 TaxID=3133428 RepID=UPI0030C2C7AC